VTFDFSSWWTVDGGLIAVSIKERYSPDSNRRHHASDDYVSEFAARAALHASGVGSKEFVTILPRRIPPSPRCSLWPTHATPFCQPCFLNDPRHTKVSRRNSRCYRLSASLFFSKPSFVGNRCAHFCRGSSALSPSLVCALDIIRRLRFSSRFVSRPTDRRGQLGSNFLHNVSSREFSSALCFGRYIAWLFRHIAELEGQLINNF
jgi:hypothetical protein